MGVDRAAAAAAGEGSGTHQPTAIFPFPPPLRFLFLPPLCGAVAWWWWLLRLLIVSAAAMLQLRFCLILRCEFGGLSISPLFSPGFDKGERRNFCSILILF
jgi:hypothetical protein